MVVVVVIVVVVAVVVVVVVIIIAAIFSAPYISPTRVSTSRFSRSTVTYRFKSQKE